MRKPSAGNTLTPNGVCDMLGEIVPQTESCRCCILLAGITRVLGRISRRSAQRSLAIAHLAPEGSIRRAAMPKIRHRNTPQR